MDRQTLEKMTSGERAEIIAQCEALISAARRTQLAAIAVADDLEDWDEDGANSMVAWLRMRLGVHGSTASELVRVAHCLEELPRIAEAFDAGRLCWDQLRPVTELATPELDEAVAADAPGRTATQLRRAALRARRVTSTDSEEAHEARYLSMHWDLDRRALRLEGLLPEDTGAAVEAALTRIVDQRVRERDRAKAAEARPPDEETGASEAASGRLPPLDRQYADALVELARTRLAADPDPDRATIVLHVDATALSGGPGACEISGGPPLSLETVMRLACDARLQLVADGPDGRPVGVGTTTRTVPPWLMRLLVERDEHCRWPGCTRRRLLQAHHCVQVKDGGPTDLQNLALICPRHHRFLHEKGWRIEGDPSGELRFVTPDGRVLTSRPPDLRPEIRERLLGDAPEPSPTTATEPAPEPTDDSILETTDDSTPHPAKRLAPAPRRARSRAPP